VVAQLSRPAALLSARRASSARVIALWYSSRMLRTSCAVLLGALTLFACGEDALQSPPAASPFDPPTTVAAASTPPPPDPGATIASPVSLDAGVVALATLDASAPTSDEGVDPQYRACSADSDCVAVARNGCCHNGRNVGVAVAQKDAYLKSFTCPEKHPKCPMYRLKHDDRVGACDGATHLCGLK
jgi:hypothetical protein